MQITVANKEKSIIELIHSARVFFVCFSFNKLTVIIIKYVLTKRKPETKFISSAVITEKQLEIIIIIFCVLVFVFKFFINPAKAIIYIKFVNVVGDTQVIGANPSIRLPFSLHPLKKAIILRMAANM